MAVAGARSLQSVRKLAGDHKQLWSQTYGDGSAPSNHPQSSAGCRLRLLGQFPMIVYTMLPKCRLAMWSKGML